VEEDDEELEEIADREGIEDIDARADRIRQLLARAVRNRRKVTT